jgi:WD40 repeat protein
MNFHQTENCWNMENISQLEEIAKCPVCFDLHEDNRAFLPCRHSICVVCCQQWLSKGSNFCPVCRTKVENIPKTSDPKAFPPDFQKNSMIQVISKMSGISIQPKSEILSPIPDLPSPRSVLPEYIPPRIPELIKYYEDIERQKANDLPSLTNNYQSQQMLISGNFQLIYRWLQAKEHALFQELENTFQEQQNVLVSNANEISRKIHILRGVHEKYRENEGSIKDYVDQEIQGKLLFEKNSPEISCKMNVNEIQSIIEQFGKIEIFNRNFLFNEKLTENLNLNSQSKFEIVSVLEPQKNNNKQPFFRVKDFELIEVKNSLKILLAGESREILVWDVEKNEKEKLLEGHFSFINCLAVCKKKNFLLSGSVDKTIRVWNLASDENNNNNNGALYSSLKVLSGHENYVVCMKVHQNFLFSGGRDFTIKRWNLENFQLENTIVGHKGDINDLEISEKFLFSCSDDKTIRVWNLRSFQCEKVLEGHKDWVSKIRLRKDHLWSASHDKTIRRWNVESLICDKVYNGHTRSINSILVLSDSYFLTSSEDNTMRLWQTDKEVCEKMVVDGSPISTLKTRGNNIYGVSAEKVLVWCVES